MQPRTILGIDPGTKEMGMAVLRGRELLGYGVHSLRNCKNPYDLIGQARRVLLRYLEQYEPDTVAIEKPYTLPTKRGAILSVIAQELHSRARELGLRVVELSPEEIRRRVVGDSRATKIRVAEALVASGLEGLRPLLPKRRARAALGYRARDKYWLHVFDALAMSVAAAHIRSV